MTFWRADGVLALAGMATTAVRQAAAKAKLAETLRIMTITCELGPGQTFEERFRFRINFVIGAPNRTSEND